ncbi:hypothetical protein AMK33_23370 [Streptomyces sp. CB02400]|nr:hypothetical protein AMK33_23370 [Streptomyces sp. CB02400]
MLSEIRSARDSIERQTGTQLNVTGNTAVNIDVADNLSAALPVYCLLVMGLALAVGVLVDAFIVRMTLVPAVMTLLGHQAWWLPRFLQRILPDVDVEGEQLMRHSATPQTLPHQTPQTVPVLHDRYDQ